jgi:integrase
MFFDPRAAKALQPGEHLVVVGCPGLRLVASGPYKTWTYRYKPAGATNMKQVSLGHWPAVSVAEAVAAWSAKREARASGGDPQADKAAAQAAAVARSAKPDAGPTVERIVRRYVKGHLHASRTPASALAAERALLAMLEAHPDVAATPAAQLTRAQAYAVIDAKRATPTAAARLRSLLGAAWDDAYDPGVLPQDAPNWWRQVLRGKLKSRGKIVGGEHQGPKRRVLRLDEVGALLAWAGEHMHELALDVLVLYLWTGARGSEILSMRPERVGEEPTGWWWTVPAAATKNAGHEFAQDLRVPLFGRALAVVQRRIKAAGADGLMWESTRGRAYTQHDFSTYVYDLQPYSMKAQARPGRAVLPVTHWTPHHLRRTVRTQLAALGCPREVGEAILGHMPEVIEATYNLHSYDAERREWLGRWAGVLEGV